MADLSRLLPRMFTRDGLRLDCFLPTPRLHGSTSYRVPWAYDEEAVDVVRFFTRLKAKLMPYLYRNAIETSRTGVPVMRSMVLEYTEDKNCTFLDKQYFFGDSMLAAPFLMKRAGRNFICQRESGPISLREKCMRAASGMKNPAGYLSIPVFCERKQHHCSGWL